MYQYQKLKLILKSKKNIDIIAKKEQKGTDPNKEKGPTPTKKGTDPNKERDRPQ